MLTVIKNGIPTGTQYTTNERKFYEHHEQYDEVLIDYDMPIVFDDGVLITPFNLTDTEIQASAIRAKREVYCFDLVNRGAVWYDALTVEQKDELTVWYRAWLDAPDTLVIPEDLAWLC